MKSIDWLPSKSKGLAYFIARSRVPLVVMVLSSCVSENTPSSAMLAPVVLNSLSVASYDTTSANLILKGKVQTADITSLTSIRFHAVGSCTDSAIGTGTESDFEGSGISVLVPSAVSTPIFLNTNTDSTCYSVITYDPSHAAPAIPVFTSTVPISPSRTSTTPIIFGTPSPTTSSVQFFDDSTCSHSVGAGSAGNLSSVGITLTLVAETSNAVYVKAFEPFGNASACSLFTTYIHTTAGPNPPVYSAISPVSPSNLSSTPSVTGIADATTATVKIFNDPACTVQVASGTKAEFTSTGVALTVADNSSTAFYAVAYDATLRPSICAYLTTYVYDIIAPTAPTFVSISPAAQTRFTIYPSIKGIASADTAVVKLYNDSTCTTQIGAGTKIQFETAGLTAGARSNDLTKIYAFDIDGAGNTSPCTFLVDFINDTIPPDAPVFATTVPISPNNQSITPLILGNAPIDAVSVSLFSDILCTTAIGAGTAAAFTNPGIQATVVGNTTTQIYAEAFDAVGNASTCTLMTSYMHSTAPAPVPVFSQTLPASPSRVTLTPWVRGTASSSITTVKLFNDVACTTQIASGSRPTFQTSGIQITVPVNSLTTIYAMGIDIYGNQSPCVHFTDYIHENRPPLDPILTNSSPVSPNNSSTSPVLIGTANGYPSSQLTPNVMSIYDSPVCTNRLGTGTPAAFSGAGILVNVSSDTTTSLYGRSFDAAGNISNCVYLMDYTHDSLKPGRPVLSATLPASPSYTKDIVVTGSLAATTDFLAAATVTIYTDPSCTTALGSALPSVYFSTGIPVTVPANQTTPLYADTTNIVGTHSTCAFLKNFLHSDVGPTNLIANVNPNGAVSIGWNPDMTANPSPVYKLHRAVKSGGPYTTIATGILGTSFTDRSTTVGASYFYVVSALNNTGESKYSTEASATISIGTSASPNSLVATAGPDQITLNWSGFSSSLFYKVFRSASPGGPYTQILSNLASTTYIDKGVVADVPYYYVVTGSNPAGESVMSNEAAAAAKDIPPAPTGLTLTSYEHLAACLGGPGVILNWNAPAFYTNFSIRMSSTSSITKNPRFTVIGTTYTDCNPTITNNPNFFGIFYDVQSLFGNLISSPSNEVGLHVVPLSGLIATPGNGAINLDWTNSGGASSYNVFRSTAQGGPYTLLASGVPFNTYVDNAVVNGTAYYYTVAAVFADSAPGLTSGEVSAIPGPNIAPPSGLNLTVSANQPVLDWVPPSMYSGFTIYRAPAVGGPYSVIGTALTPNYTDMSVPNGRNYYYVTANWGGFETTQTNTVSYRHGLPVTFTATPSPTNVSLSWAAVAGASSYQVKRSLTSQGPYTVIAAANATTSYVDSAVTVNTGYYYVISANFADGTFGENSAEKSAMPGNGKIPSGLTILSIGSGSATLGWAPVASATTYRVYQSKNVLAGPYTQVATNVAGTSKALTGLLAQTTYYFKVTSVVAGVESAQSPAIMTWTANPPGGPNVSAGNSSVGLTWTPLPGAPTFTVQRSTNGIAFTTIASGISSTSYTDNTAVNGTMYFYQLIAAYSGATLTGPMSAAVVPGIVPGIPAALTAVPNNTGTDVTFGWAPVGGATGYNLYASTSSGGPYGLPVISTSGTNNVLVSGLTAGTTYYFVLTSTIGTVESGYSSEISVIPSVPPAAPVTTAAGLSVNVAWSAVPGATIYDIQRTDGGGIFTQVATGVAGTAYVDNTVLFGYPYIYQYIPRNASNTAMTTSYTSVPVTPGAQPLAPLALHAEAAGTSVVNLSWVSSLNIVSYNVYRGSVSGGPYSLLTTVGAAATSFSDATVSAGNTYYYVVTSVNSSLVESVYSNEQGVKLLNSPTGLSAINGANSILLSWTAAPGATGYVVRRGTQTGGAYGLLAANNATTTFTDTNVENGVVYFYVIDTIFAGGIISNHSNEATAIGIVNLNLQIPIELTDRSIASNVSPLTFDSTQTSLDTAAYDGVVTYGLEVIATNVDTTSKAVNLVNSTGTVIGSVSIPAATASPTRIRTSFTPTAGLNIYRLQLAATSALGQLEVNSARVWVTQVGATRTRLYIPLLASGAPATSNDASPVSTSSFLGYSDLTEATFYHRDTSVYTKMADNNPWELETVVSALGGAVGTVALYDASLGAVVSDTETVFSDTVPTLVDSPFEDGVTNFGSANELEDFQVSVACQTGCTGGSTAIYKAGLWLTLTNLSHLQVTNRIGLGGALPTSVIVGERTLLDLAKFSNPLVYFQSVANPPNMGSSSLDLMNAGTSEAGVAGLTAVSGSTLNFNTYTKTWVRSGPLTIPTGKRLVPQVTSTGGNTTVTDTSIIIDITR